jgi:hypothetical protein
MLLEEASVCACEDGAIACNIYIISNLLDTVELLSLKSYIYNSLFCVFLSEHTGLIG